MRLIRYPHAPLRSRVWELRENLSAYDAVYLALTEMLLKPSGGSEAKVAACHTDSDDYRPEDELVYHDNDECGNGNRIKRDGNAKPGHGWSQALRPLRRSRLTRCDGTP